MSVDNILRNYLKKRMKRKDFKELEVFRKEMSMFGSSISNKLDDICIKHHGGLPYEPF